MSTTPNPAALTTDERFQQLEQRMAEHQLQTQQQIAEVLNILGQLKAASGQPTPVESADNSPQPEAATALVSRRSMLTKAALAALGAATVLETMPSARAGGTNGGALVLGQSNTATASTTITTSSGYGLSAANGTTQGILGYANVGGVVGFSDAGRGVYGSSGSGYGVSGMSNSSSGLYGGGAQYGAYLQGLLAAVRLATPGAASTPYDDNHTHLAGELYVDNTKGLWYCIEGGSPGAWNRLAGTLPANSFGAGNFAVLAAPTRFIDTRPASASYTPDASAPAPGSVVTNYIFTGTNALVAYAPMGTTPPVLPHGATALVGRITVLSGQSSIPVGGELKVSDVTPPNFGSGLVIWGTTPATQIVPFVLSLNNANNVNSGVMYFQNTSVSDNIDLIVDVTGYYY